MNIWPGIFFKIKHCSILTIHIKDLILLWTFKELSRKIPNYTKMSALIYCLISDHHGKLRA